MYLYMLDYAEPKLEEPMEQVQAEDFTNLALSQGKFHCIPSIFLGFSF
jgi:hypothetical protein